MSQYEIDYLHDKEANSWSFGYAFGGSRSVLSGLLFLRIGTLMPKKRKKWGAALDLDQGGRDDFKGHDIQYYLICTMRLEPKR
jgi:hypothetical protein